MAGHAYLLLRTTSRPFHKKYFVFIANNLIVAGRRIHKAATSAALS
jgi:hypothetical protein